MKKILLIWMLVLMTLASAQVITLGFDSNWNETISDTPGSPAIVNSDGAGNLEANAICFSDNCSTQQSLVLDGFDFNQFFLDQEPFDSVTLTLKDFFYERTNPAIINCTDADADGIYGFYNGSESYVANYAGPNIPDRSVFPSLDCTPIQEPVDIPVQDVNITFVKGYDYNTTLGDTGNIQTYVSHLTGQELYWGHSLFVDEADNQNPSVRTGFSSMEYATVPTGGFTLASVFTGDPIVVPSVWDFRGAFECTTFLACDCGTGGGIDYCAGTFATLVTGGYVGTQINEFSTSGGVNYATWHLTGLNLTQEILDAEPFEFFLIEFDYLQQTAGGGTDGNTVRNRVIGFNNVSSLASLPNGNPNAGTLAFYDRLDTSSTSGTAQVWIRPDYTYFTRGFDDGNTFTGDLSNYINNGNTLILSGGVGIKYSENIVEEMSIRTPAIIKFFPGNNTIPPVIDNVTIIPSGPLVGLNDALQGWCTPSDADTVNLNIQFQWYKNGAPYSSGTYPSNPVITGTPTLVDTIPSNQTSTGDIWQFRCQADDNKANTGFIASPSVVIDSYVFRALESYGGAIIPQFTVTVSNSTFSQVLSSAGTGVVSHTSITGELNYETFISQLNPADTHPDITLSLNNTQFTKGAANPARTTRSMAELSTSTSEILYYSLLVGADDNELIVGWGADAQSVNIGPGDDANSVGMSLENPNAEIRYNGIIQDTIADPADPGDRVLTAYDTRDNTVYWYVSVGDTGIYNLVDNFTLPGPFPTLFAALGTDANGIGIVNFTDQSNTTINFLKSQFDVNVSDTIPYNITFTQPPFKDVIVENYFYGNSNLDANMFQSNVTISIFEVITNNILNSWTLVTEEGNYSTTDGVLELEANLGTFNWDIVPNPHFPKLDIEFIIANGTEMFNITGFGDLRLNFRGTDNQTNESVEGFTVTIDNLDTPFQLNVSTDNFVASADLLVGNYSFLWDAPGYTLDFLTAEYLIPPTEQNVSFTGQGSNEIILQWIDEETNLPFIGNVTYVMTGPEGFILIDTTNESVELFGQVPGTYQLVYGAPGYAERQFNFILQDKTDQQINAYLVPFNATIDVIFTVLDQDAFPLEGGVVKALRFYPLDNAYQQVDSKVINFEGEALLKLVPIDPFYKFVIEDNDGNILKETSPTQIFDNSYFIQVNTETEGVFDSFFGLSRMEYSLRYDKTSEAFIFTYADSNNLVETATLDIVKITALGDQIISTQTIESQAATLIYPVSANETGTLEARASIETNTAFSPWFAVIQEDFQEANLGITGLFLTLILVVTVAFVGAFNPVALVAATLFALFIAAVTGLAALEMGFIVMAAVAGAVIMGLSKT